MVLERLVFANPGGWWAFGAVVAVAVLYLFYRRYRPLPVTGLFLWGAPRRDGGGGSQVEKPLLNRSFWLDLAAAALFALALIGPGWRSEQLTRVIVLDNSIAMQSRLCFAEAARQVAAMWSADQPTAVIFAGKDDSVVREPALTSRSETEAWLAARYRPGEPTTDLQKAVLLARELYGDAIDLHLFTNRDAPEVVYSDALTMHILAGRGGNLSLNHVWRRTRGNGEEVLVTLMNYNDVPVKVDLAVTPATEPNHRLYSETATLPPGANERRIALDRRHAATLVLSLTTDDATRDVIAADSQAFLPSTPESLPTYGVTGLEPTAERYVALALEAAGCRRAELPAAAELLVTADAEARGSLATLRILSGDQPGYLTPPYLVDFTSELCRDLDVSQVAWVAASRDYPAAPEAVYISAGRLPLYWREGNRYLLNLSLAHGGLPRDPAWPVLMANLARQCGALRPGLTQTAYQPGATLRYARPYSPSRQTQGLRLFSGDNLMAASTGSRALPLPHLPGLYRLEAEGEPAGEASVLPLYGSAADTRSLAPAARTETRGNRNAADEGVRDLRWLALLLGCAALGCNFAARRKNTTGEAA